MMEIRLSKEWMGFTIIVAFQFMINYLITGSINSEDLIRITLNNTVLIYIISFIAYELITELKSNSFYRDIAFCMLGMAVYISLSMGENQILSYNRESPNAALQLNGLMNLLQAFFLLKAVKYINKPISFKRMVSYYLASVLGGVIFIYTIGERLAVVLETTQKIRIHASSHFIALLIYIVILVCCYKVKDKFMEQDYINFSRYIICKILLQVLMMTMGVDISFINSVMVSGVGIITTYYLFKIFLGKFINRSASGYYNNRELENKELTRIVKELNDTKQELQGSLKEYKELVAFLPEGIIIVQNNVISFANDKMAHLFKLISPSSLEEKNIFNIIHPIDHRKFKELLENHQESEMALIHFSLIGNDFVGEVRFVNRNTKERKSYTVIVKDLTEQIKILKMEHMLVEKREEEKIKNEVLANISHEFKTPVNVIYAAAQLQEQNILSKDWEAVRKYTPVMRQNCNRLIRLINNFIDITRLDHGEIHIKKVYANIVPIIEDVTLSIISFAENKGISVLFDTEEEEIYCYIDIDLVERVMLNLLSNAIKYNKVDGSIIVTLNNKEEQVGISVKDSGVGIEKEYIKILFNRFERGDKSLTRDNEGSGLGLNIAKNMIECLQGTIEVESVLGEGTNMIVYLPKAKEADGINYEQDAYHYDTSRLKKNVEMELSDIYE
ncbi:MAG: ATP-binding protein [Cellulosilyticaceae bacterium]